MYIILNKKENRILLDHYALKVCWSGVLDIWFVNSVKPKIFKNKIIAWLKSFNIPNAKIVKLNGKKLDYNHHSDEIENYQYVWLMDKKTDTMHKVFHWRSNKPYNNCSVLYPDTVLIKGVGRFLHEEMVIVAYE